MTDKGIVVLALVGFLGLALGLGLGFKIGWQAHMAHIGQAYEVTGR